LPGKAFAGNASSSDSSRSRSWDVNMIVGLLFIFAPLECESIECSNGLVPAFA
jgi:hypothetical protein